MRKKKVFSSEIVRFIEGIGPKNGLLLAHKVNIKTLEDLRKADLEGISQATGISKKRLSCWRSSAILQKIIGIDGQIAEVLVKNGIRDIIALRNADPKKFIITFS